MTNEPRKKVEEEPCDFTPFKHAQQDTSSASAESKSMVADSAVLCNVALKPPDHSILCLQKWDKRNDQRENPRRPVSSRNDPRDNTGFLIITMHENIPWRAAVSYHVDSHKLRAENGLTMEVRKGQDSHQKQSSQTITSGSNKNR